MHWTGSHLDALMRCRLLVQVECKWHSLQFWKRDRDFGCASLCSLGHGGADNSSKPTKSAAANFFEATKQMQGRLRPDLLKAKRKDAAFSAVEFSLCAPFRCLLW